MKKSLTVKEMARMGGKARTAQMTPEERSTLGRKAAQTRWGKRGKDAEEKLRRKILGESG